ncbi:MAG TPA: hypothetical protein H9669_10310 [Firmicutes bacterium]|nr:hypothetical protein [Bacillota bacterium]
MTKVIFGTKSRALEINGKEYQIAERTGTLVKRITEEHDEKLGELTEYERYKVLISAILGEEAFAELFPNGEEESLNKMAQVAWYAQEEFNADIKEMERQKRQKQTEDTLEDMEKFTAKLAKVNKEVTSALSKAELAAAKRKRR